MEQTLKIKRKRKSFKQFMSREYSKILFLLAFVIPAFVLYFWTHWVPAFDSITGSFDKWNGFGDPKFVGFNNYLSIIQDPVFWKAVKNSLLFVLGKEILIVPTVILFAVSLTKMRLKKAEMLFYRYVFYIPNIISISIIGILWTFIFNPANGLLNSILSGIGLESWIPETGWLVDYTMPSVIVVASWCGIGYFMIILISAINSIPISLYEAADIDGAGQWRQLWNVTMPTVWEHVRFMIIQILVGGIGSYEIVMLMLGGAGVDNSGITMGYYAYFYGLDSPHPAVGYSYAASVLILILTSTITLICNRIVAERRD